MSESQGSKPHILVLADDRAGNVSQALGVAEALGQPFAVLEVRYDQRGGWHNLLRGASLRGIAAETRSKLDDLRPALVIAAGRRTAPLARWFKHHRGSRLVQVMDPGWPGRGDFDLIAIPRHDDAPAGTNVVLTVGSCHRASPQRLAAARSEWEARLAALPRPYVAVLVGGATKDYAFDPQSARQLTRQVADLAKSLGGSVLATTSRRTGAEIEQIIADGVPEPRFLHRWAEGGDNPYLGFLAMADVLVVTGDSMSMCSEACANGGPVYIFAPPGMVKRKHARLHDLLYRLGYARPLGDGALGEGGGNWSHPPLNAAVDVAGIIRAKGWLAT